MKAVITHSGLRHLDDTISTILYSHKFKIENIILVHPQSVDKSYLMDKNYILIDVGMEYNPELNNFDHHQNLNIPCSLILIIKHFFNGEIDPESLFIKQIDIIDRFGFNKANIEPNVKIDEMRKVILMSDLFNKDRNVYKIVYDVVKNASNNNYHLYEFIENLYNILDQIGAIEDGKLALENEKKAIQEAINNIKLVKLNNQTIAISNNTISKNMKMILEKYPEIDIIVERNSMNPNHTSIIVNSNKENYDQLVELANEIAKKNGNIIFEHKNRFIRVIDSSIENFVIK